MLRVSFKSYLKTASALTAFALITLSTGKAFAVHTLNKEKSALNFISIKNEHIAESHTFDQYSGSLSKDGKLSITIDLSSVNTLIPIRNERMQKMLFDVANYKEATFTAMVSKDLLKLKAGQARTASVAGEITIKGATVPVNFDIAVVGLEKGGLRASTVKPTLLSTSSFGLDGGIDALKTVAMLNSISKTVPLTFDVVFEQ
jgi:polyisoprenoid-binding protein YceI